MKHINRIDDLALVDMLCPKCGLKYKEFCCAYEEVFCNRCNFSGKICIKENSKGCRWLEIEWDNHND